MVEDFVARTLSTRDCAHLNHCHIHGHVRGILCNECNRGLGYYHDNPVVLRRAAQYIEEN